MAEGSIAEVLLWDRVIGAVAWDAARDLGAFEYAREFQSSWIELAPLMMPLGAEVFRFPGLARDSFQGLPGMLADCLPDKFGNLLIDQWLAREGRVPGEFNPVERLCYLGTRAMGALEFRPALRRGREASQPLQIDALVRLANEALSQKGGLAAMLGEGDQDQDEEAVRAILRVGTSAGGARAKAVIAWNPKTHEVRSGQVDGPRGFEHWLIKFDGVSGNRDKEATDEAQGYGLIEYAYHRMALAAGIEMSECRLLEEGGRSHFMTRRFDRADDGRKWHLQSLCALAHYDFNRAGAYSYEQAMAVMDRLDLPREAMVEQFRRMVFNVVARNQDDHSKNIAFLMDRKGRWKLSPAYDVTYSYNPSGVWTGSHQMTVNGKRDGFEREDFLQFARRFHISQATAKRVMAQVHGAVGKWMIFAEEAGVPEEWAEEIQGNQRLDLVGGAE